MDIINNYITSKNRPRTKRSKTTKIAIHYVGNAGSTAIANRNYFQNTLNEVSSNYIVGLEGEVICCIPHDEIAWCTNNANAYSVSIETCHPKTDGKFNEKTYKSLVELSAYLLNLYKLTYNDLIRHFDVTGKVCPKSFVAKSKGGTDDEKLTAWNKFKADVKKTMVSKEVGNSSSSSNTNSNLSNSLNSNPNSSTSSNLYRVRKTWLDSKSQIGAYKSLDNAKKACKKGYTVYDESGRTVYTKANSNTSKPSNPTSGLTKGNKLLLKDVSLFVSATAKTGNKKTGTYYIYDGAVVNSRLRITNKLANCGKSPIGMYVTGWIRKSDI
ncbi:MAG: N-acetylmuramoyl-L-alanine amidase [Clostridiales bacterium]|nr:N-acetylmuramoyl-L-alanine amidase [Clostridiales bacterium]